jgi:hypothetical protein
MNAEHAPLKLTIDGMPAMKCPKGHAAPVDDDFMFWLIQELKEKASSIPGGEEKGLFLKKYICACGARIPAKPDQRRSFPAALTYDGKFKFKASFDMPVFKCTGCGKDMLRSVKELQRDISHAMADVTDAAGFPHG